MASGGPAFGCAVVIGIGPGLGTSVARKFAKEGYPVALVARSEKHLKPLQATIEKQGGKALSVCADASSEQSLKDAFGVIRSQLGDVEVLVYNAGGGMPSWPPPPVMELDTAVFVNNLQVGCTGAFVAIKEVLPAMTKHKKGTILLTGATASLRGGARFAALAVHKFALRALAQCVAREVQPNGVHVAHIVIDGQIGASYADEGEMTYHIRKSQPDRAEDSFLNPDAIAATYWHLHTQDRTAWTHELELRPYVEKW